MGTEPDASATDPSLLAGGWLLTRRLVDRRTGGRGCVHGRLDLRPVTAGWDWVETGRLSWVSPVGGTSDAPVERHLAIRRHEGRWWVLFADGRPFHLWQTGRDLVHDCRDDTYRGRIEVPPGERPGAFRIEWNVHGPAKDQQIRTRLRRVPGGRPVPPGARP